MPATLEDMSTQPAHALRLADEVLPRDAWPPVGDRCPIARTLDVISTRSAFLILREAFYGATRFEEFVTRAEISEPVAAARLRELTGAGLLEKVPYREPGQRTRSAYQLTDQGADLLPALLALFDWGDRWLGQRPTGVALRHADCGAAVHASITCEAGHTVVADEIEIIRRSAGRSSAPASSTGRAA